MLLSRVRNFLVLLFLVLLLVACNRQEKSAESNPVSTSTNSATTAAIGNSHGQEVYNNVCHSCHSTGVAGAPKLGDHSAWEDRIDKGIDVLVQSAINGKGNMPPKGGARTLNDDDIRAAVNYMVDQAR